MFNDMRNKIIYTFFILSALSLFSVSCSSSKDNLTYFQNNDSFDIEDVTKTLESILIVLQ